MRHGLAIGAVALAGSVAAGGAAADAGPRAAHTAAGTKAAQGALLRVKDFGSGWSADPSKGAQTGIVFSCKGFSPKQGDLVEIGTATSPTFKASQVGPFVVQKTSVYANAATARTLWKRAVRPQLVDCAAQSLQALQSKGVGVTVTGRSALKLGPVADRAAGYRVIATLTTAKQRLKTFFDVILIGSGRTVTQLTISEFQTPPPAKWEQALARLAARRLGAGGPTA